MVTDRRHATQQLADVIQSRRHELGITRKVVAQRSGLSPSTITRLEQGFFAKPTPECLLAIANAIELPSEELFTTVGWLTEPAHSKPYIYITCQGVPSEVVDQVHEAIDGVTRANGVQVEFHNHTEGSRLDL